MAGEGDVMTPDDFYALLLVVIACLALGIVLICAVWGGEDE